VRGLSLFVVLGLGCVQGPAKRSSFESPAQPGVPEITGFAFQCDPDDSEWRFYLRASAWSGGARLWMTRDGSLTELHVLDFYKAAGDGSWDCHELELDIAADQREAVGSSSSRFRCGDLPELSFRVAISDTDDSAWADCLSWGADPSLLDEVPGVPSCEQLLAGADEPGALDDLSFLAGDVADCPY
jgi:hypothetical protein